MDLSGCNPIVSQEASIYTIDIIVYGRNLVFIVDVQIVFSYFLDLILVVFSYCKNKECLMALGT